MDMFGLLGALLGGFGGGGGLGGLLSIIPIYAIFFGINLVIQLLTGGLSDLFPAQEM